MYSVMIVDDEPIIRKGLKKIINWEEYGFKIACEARDGEDALELIKEYNIDFIISDIKMHKITGIELLRKIRENGLDTLVLLLSGYDEFSYAQEGIRLGAFDYILKPLDAQKLKNILINAYDKLAMKEKKDHEYNVNKIISGEKILYDLLRGKNLMLIDEYISQYNLPLVKGKVQVAIVEINEIIISSEDLTENDEWSYLNNKVNDLIEKELKKSDIEYFSVLDGDFGKKIILVQMEKDIELSDFNQKFVAVLKNILKISSENYQIKLNIGVGNAYNQLYSIYKSYLNAKEALKYKYVLGTNKLIQLTELAEIRKKNFVYPIEKEKALINSILIGRDDSLNMLRELVGEIASMLNFDIFSINIAFTQVVYNIYNNVLKKYSFLEDIYDLSQITNIGFLGVETLENIEKQLIGNINKLILIIKEYNLNQGDNIVQRACEYVLTHIDEDITLTAIANNFNISKNYLCSIFKQQTGENFLEYTTKAKMERAKILLKKYNYKVYEVSDMLGYKETAYFGKLFKKYTGYTPAEYKKCNI
ncbi:two-component system response regulator YesN [Clostridium saccharoperbutylacetonicum]|uniref:Stage 0 sporulation protein A homolog n=1 Tax=Clostridium saccharoperbutylacetonicum N1-4(HMT) TaxID=931276 RepID=M1N3K3_9CLOT|nr:response regulator [Clostridium saccharoperbutylacetonicum]AGF58047.1 response regulator [Clostridium saccharoperbutylacetonicum N1-4(HMT)]NRT61179.1 two-component system response regulator YesN [Clostridium saccharoperbutylacetonicum]NSB24495.1 two-component system response regulator YesN [Clostridium saccharoperbutylacetonicum]NSB43870.1 two-component system response regulator YesN [Clostridium saccharoperbutylacetonicum]